MEINVNSSDVRCYVVSVSITKDKVIYHGEVELYSYGGGFDEGDMEVPYFEDENGNGLDESLIDRAELFQTCLNWI
tara:strand:- start:2831 stop:3058 length:228 start_codon:yes stop_codon:yes gene_type:complete